MRCGGSKWLARRLSGLAFSALSQIARVNTPSIPLLSLSLYAFRAMLCTLSFELQLWITRGVAFRRSRIRLWPTRASRRTRILVSFPSWPWLSAPEARTYRWRSGIGHPVRCFDGVLLWFQEFRGAAKSNRHVRRRRSNVNARLLAFSDLLRLPRTQRRRRASPGRGSAVASPQQG